MNDTKFQLVREVIEFARQRDIDINRITVSPSMYGLLERGAVLSTIHVGILELRYGLTVIDKRPCKGCCEHGSNNS